MATSFVKEWSDDDSSHSSEEFMYVKGGVEVVEGRSDDGELDLKFENGKNYKGTFSEGGKEEDAEEKCEGQKPTNETNSEDIEVIDVDMEEESGAWMKKKDPIPPTPIFHGGKH
jgi:hypothetical protein